MAALILQFPEKTPAVFGTLDSLLAQGQITPEQHWCGVHLRWLHNIQRWPTSNDEWRTARSREYAKALELLDNEDGQHVVTLCLRDWLRESKLAEIRESLAALQAMWLPAKAGA